MNQNLSMESLNVKRRMIKKIWIVYGALILFLFFSALISLFFPLSFQSIMTNDVSAVSLVCLVLLQVAFDSDTEETVLYNPLDFYMKISVYIIDIYLLLMSTIKPALILITCLITGLQLLIVYFKVCYKYPLMQRGENKIEKKLKKRSEGSVIVTANICALALVFSKGFMFNDSSKDLIKAILSSALIIFYLNTALRNKAEEFLNKIDAPNEKLLAFYAFKMVKPIGAALLPKIKKLQRIKHK